MVLVAGVAAHRRAGTPVPDHQKALLEAAMEEVLLVDLEGKKEGLVEFLDPAVDEEALVEVRDLQQAAPAALTLWDQADTVL